MTVSELQLVIQLPYHRLTRTGLPQLMYVRRYGNHEEQMVTFHANPYKYSHFLHNLLNVFVGGLHSAIHLWSIRRRIVMFDIELCTELSDHLIVQIGTIIGDDSFGNAISTDEVV